MCRSDVPTPVSTTVQSVAAGTVHPWTVTYAARRIASGRPVTDRRPPLPPSDPEVSRNERKNMLCMQIAVAARYQRTLLAAGAQRPVHPHSPSLPVHPPPTRRSYMMLTAAPLRALVQDIHTLLGPTAPKDYRQSATSQVAQLGLYRPSTFTTG